MQLSRKLDKRTIKRVMLVDDEEDIRIIGEMSLVEVGGWEVQLIESGAEAVDRAPMLCPDVIILDVMMPGMDGPSTLKNLRRRPETSQTPIIFMTAKVQKDEVSRYQGLGAAGVIAKPFDPMTLPDQIRQIVDGAP